MLPLKRPMRNLPASLSRPLPPAPPPHVDFATGLWDSEAVLADPNAVSEDGEPLLVMAVRTNDTDLLGFLVNETCVDVGATNVDGLTALDVAIMDGQHECVPLVLYAGVQASSEHPAVLNNRYNFEDTHRWIADALAEYGYY